MLFMCRNAILAFPLLPYKNTVSQLFSFKLLPIVRVHVFVNVFLHVKMSVCR